MNLHVGLSQFVEAEKPTVRPALFDGRNGVEMELGPGLKIRMSSYDASWLAGQIAKAAQEAAQKQAHLEAVMSPVARVAMPQEAAR